MLPLSPQIAIASRPALGCAEKAWFCFWALLCITAPLLGQTYSTGPLDRIQDEARILETEPRQSLTEAITRWEKDTGCELRISTFTYVTGSNIRERSEQLVKAWMPDQPGFLIGYDRATELHSITPSLALWEKYPAPEIVETVRAAAAPFVEKSAPIDQRILRASEILMSHFTAAEQRRRLHQQLIQGSEHEAALLFGGVLIAGSVLVSVLIALSRRRAAQRAVRYFFPSIEATERLGAPYGGGVIAEQR